MKSNKESYSVSGLTASRSHSASGLIAILMAVVALCATSCNPEAPWTTDNVTVNMKITTVSAGFAECSFSTNKEAYYFIACEPVRAGYDPMQHQKQFMMLALDSAYSEYLMWRTRLLRDGELNVASFSNHSLYYGQTDYFFTGLLPEQDYWIYAFVVDIETLKPAGKLYLQQITTTSESIIDVHFDYRVKGLWDYIYPHDTLGNIYTRFPYIATTRDSADLADKDSITGDMEAIAYFVFWSLERFLDPSKANVLYGVRAIENDGWQTNEVFEEGHTYYTAISGYDGSFKQTTVYKFHWTGDSCNYYFRDTDPANIVNLLPNNN